MFILYIIMINSKAWFYSTALCFIVTVIVVTNHVTNVGFYEAKSFVLVKWSWSCVWSSTMPCRNVGEEWYSQLGAGQLYPWWKRPLYPVNRGMA